MENDKDGIYLMPDWFQEKARRQVRKEIADEESSNDQTERKAGIRQAMKKEAEKLLGNSDSDRQDTTAKHIYI